MKTMLDSDEALGYGIVSVSVANLRPEPTFQSELISQTLMGTVLPILEEEGQFYRIQNWDGYRGWVSKLSVAEVEREEAQAWESAERGVVTENYGVVRAEPTESGEILSDLVPAIVFKKVSTHAAFTEVELPDARRGYVDNHLIMDEAAHRKIRISAQNLLDTSKRFLGVAYLWGGTSAKGFDCSGFVQTVFRLLNVELPRDSRPMANVGQEVPAENGSGLLKTGDLLFFGKSTSQINHVAIYLGGGNYIHARGRVRINSLFPESPLYDDYLFHLWVKTRRVVEI